MRNIKITLFILFTNLLFCEISNAQKPSCETGTASYYASEFHGKKTASGEKYNMNALTAAHNTLPFNTYVKVTNLSNNLSVIVRINDRGPHTKKRIIDLSKAAAKKIGLIQCGVAKVKVEIIDKDEESDKEKEAKLNKEKEDELKKEQEEKSNKEKDDILKKEKEKELTSDLDVKDDISFQKGFIYDTYGKKVNPTGYGIQLISVSNKKAVFEEIEKLESKFKILYVEAAEVNSKIVYRIITGKFSDKKSAQQELKKVKSAGYKGLIKKYK